MKNVSKLVVRMGLLSLLSVMPLAAQIDNGVNFTTSFPFYADCRSRVRMACIRRWLSSYPRILRNLIPTPMSPSTNTETPST